MVLWTGQKSFESHKEMRVIRSEVEWNEHENQKTVETTVLREESF
jgi:hypothetical protein